MYIPAILGPGESRPLGLRLAPAGAPWNKHALVDIGPCQDANCGRLTITPSPRLRANAGSILALTVHNRTDEVIRLEWGQVFGHVLRVEEEEEGGSGGHKTARCERDEAQVDLELLGLPVHNSDQAACFSCGVMEVENFKRRHEKKRADSPDVDSDDSLDSLFSSDDEEVAALRKAKKERRKLDRRQKLAQKRQESFVVKADVGTTLPVAVPSAAVLVEDPDELIASEATDFLNTIPPEILHELSEQLAAAPPTTGNDWEEFNPTFTTFNLDDATISGDVDLPDLAEGVVEELDDVDEESADLLLPSVNDDIGKNNDNLIANVLVGDSEKALASFIDNEIVADNSISSPLPSDRQTASNAPPPIDISDLEPMKIRRKVSIKRSAAVTVDETRPLIPQLTAIRSKIGSNPVVGDIADQFPSLLGQEQYLPLYETLVRYMYQYS